MDGNTVTRSLHRTQHVLAAGDHRAVNVEHDDLRALRAAVDADQEGASH